MNHALNRSQQAALTLLGDTFSGVLTSDRCSAYTWVDVCRQQICWVHLKRDFTQIAERAGVSKVLGEGLPKILHQSQ